MKIKTNYTTTITTNTTNATTTSANTNIFTTTTNRIQASLSSETPYSIHEKYQTPPRKRVLPFSWIS